MHQAGSLTFQVLPYFYLPLSPAFMWGDPHFQSVDGIDFTFNGRGEFVLVQAAANELEIQARFVEQSATTNATITTGVAIKYMCLPVVEMLIDSATQQLQLYIDGVVDSIPDDNAMTIVSSHGVFDNATEFAESGVDPTDSIISVVNDGQQLLVTIGSGAASLMVAQQSTFLRIALELSDAFVNDTRGLLGVLNGNPSDDFTLPDGSELEPNANESTIYTMFGLKCKHTEIHEQLTSAPDISMHIVHAYIPCTSTWHLCLVLPLIKTACSPEILIMHHSLHPARAFTIYT